MATLWIAPSKPENLSVVKEFYQNHSTLNAGDAGIDLFCIEEQRISGISKLIHLGISCKMEYRVGPETRQSSFYLMPRSSTGLRTPLRLSNSMGLIDSGYRGEIMAIVDNVENTVDDVYTINRGERLFQIVSPILAPLTLKFVETLEELGNTERGSGGLGSTGK